MSSAHDPTDIQAIERADAAKQQDAKRKQDSEVDDVRWLMGTLRGRRIVRRLLDQAGVYRSSFHTNALEMARLEGERNAGLRLLKPISAHCPELFVLLLKEGAKAKRSDDSSSDDRRTKQ